MSAAAPIRALSIHANYGCRDSGACCTAGWRIPVEPATEHAVTSLIAAGALTRENDDPFERQEGLTVTALAADGACVFFERGSSMTPHRCAIHRVAGHDAKPLACRQFPRVSLQDARGISVSLSHFCPTAAELLFGPGVPLEIVEAPPAFPSTGDYDGLNAMDALPPLVAPGMLMDLEAYDAWERHMVAVLSRSSSAAAALDRLASDVELLRAWRPSHGPLVDVMARLAADTQKAHGAGHRAHGGPLAEARAVYARVSRATAALATPVDLRPVDGARVSPEAPVPDVTGWDEWEAVLCRYLAARAFANWMAYQGRGLRTVIASLHVALDLVRSEAASLMADSDRPLDRSIVKKAIRQADLRLLHHADSQRLADLLGGVEE
jgi:Fe-S-cluster containining protein